MDRENRATGGAVRSDRRRPSPGFVGGGGLAVSSGGTFAHLHCHSEYSMLDGASRIRDLISFAKAENMPGIALTDHGVMYGAVKFYKEARDEIGRASCRERV